MGQVSPLAPHLLMGQVSPLAPHLLMGQVSPLAPHLPIEVLEGLIGIPQPHSQIEYGVAAQLGLIPLLTLDAKLGIVFDVARFEQFVI
jgi:hypothetical protein